MANPEEHILSLIYEQLSATQRYRLALALLQDYVPEDLEMMIILMCKRILLLISYPIALQNLEKER